MLKEILVIGAVGAVAVTVADKFNLFGINPSQTWWWQRMTGPVGSAKTTATLPLPRLPSLPIVDNSYYKLVQQNALAEKELIKRQAEASVTYR
jgi:hypothetical protein